MTPNPSIERTDPIIYPAPCSYTAADASKWFIASVKLIPGAVASEKNETDRLREAWNLKSRLRLGAALSLYDQELVQEFFAAFPLPSIPDLLEGTRSSESGKASVEAAIDTLSSFSEKQRRAFPGTVGEAIGLELRNVNGQNFVMTESGWQPMESK